MASYGHDGGVGGKFRRRPFRRASETPYDRPRTAIRRANPHLNHNNPMNGANIGWLSKIVDPASRIISRSASKFFSSVFQKRLTSPQPQPPPPEENLCFNIRAPEVVCNNLQMQKPSDKALEQVVNVGENVANLCDTDGTQQETVSQTDGFFELEQLLKQKTFTREEFDRLTDLLRSRTVEPSTTEPAVDCENKEEAIVTDEVQNNAQSIIEPNTSQPVVGCERKEKIIVSQQEDRINSTSFHRNLTDFSVLHIPEEEAISAAEIAKAYMGSRPSKVSPSALSLRTQILQEDATLPTEPYAKKPSSALSASRSYVPFSRIMEHSENGYMTPGPQGRSALHKMSRSPYFKVHQTTYIRGGRPVRNGLACSSTSSPLVQSKFMLSSGKQVLKRGSSVLDSDYASFGPIRRIRWKADLMSPSSERHSSPPRNLLPSLRTPLDQDVNQRSVSTTQKTFAGVTPVPPQSTEMARKIFQELGKLVPSPREKLSEKKGNGSLDAARDSPLPSLRNSISPKQVRVMEHSPSENAVSAVKATDGVVGINNSVTFATDVKSSRKIAETAISGSSITPWKEPAFQMMMAEESLELEAYEYNTDTASEISASGNDEQLGKSLAYPSKSIPASIYMLKGKADVKASGRPSTEKGIDFLLSAAPSSGSQSSPMASTLPSLADRSFTKKEISVQASKTATEGLSTTAAMCGPASLRVGARSTGAPISVPVSGDKAIAGYSDGTSPFGTSTSVAPRTSNAFSNADMTVSAQASVFSSTGATLSAAAASALLPSATNGSSLLTNSSAFLSPINGIFGFSTAAQSSSPSSSFAQNKFSKSGGVAGSTFGAQPTESESGTTSFPDSSLVQCGSSSSGPTFGINASSLLSSTSSLRNATSVGKAFSSHTGFSSAFAGSSSSANIPSSAPTASTGLFSSNTQPSSSSMLASTLGSNPSLPSTAFSFRLPASSSVSFTSPVGASSGPVFSFSSVRTATSSASPSLAQPVPNIPMEGTGFDSNSPGDDRMSVGNAMIADNTQAAAPSVPTFGQPADSLSAPNSQFGAPAALSGGPSVFQFGNNHNSTIPQSPSPFQSAGSFEFSAGASFSLGSGGGDKSGRRIVRVKRDKHRKK